MKLFLAFVFSMTFLPNLAPAASFEVVDNDQCLLWLKGPIVPGDFNDFYATLLSNGLTPEKLSRGDVNYPTGLCLDSLGGSAFEGQLIAEFLHSIGMPTQVPAEAKCYSACAIVFMAGRALGGEFDSPNRRLSALGIVGFHAPYPALKPGDSLTKDEIMAIFEAYRVLVASMMEFGGNKTEYSSKPTMSISLLEDLFSMAPDELKTIDTIEDALLWSVTLIDIPEEAVVDASMRSTACKNFLSWNLDKRFSDDDFDFDRPSKFVNGHVYGRVRSFEVFDHGRDAPIYCFAEVVDGPTRGILICSDDGHRGVKYGNCNAEKHGSAQWVPWFAGLNANTSIRDLKKWQ